jgi:propionyl-CoA synthetase
MTGAIQTFTYRELLDRVARFTGALNGLGVEKGDRVIIYMPMVPEAVYDRTDFRTLFLAGER